MISWLRSRSGSLGSNTYKVQLHCSANLTDGYVVI